MSAWSLFNVVKAAEIPVAKVRREDGMQYDDAAAPRPAPVPIERQGVFVTPQSLTSFAGATGVVSLLWRTCGAIRPGWETDRLVALLCAIAIGLAIYLMNETDPAVGVRTPRDRVIGAVIGLINTLVLYSATVGAAVIVS